MTNNFDVNDKVIKKSGKPFKSTKYTEVITSFSINQADPDKRICAVFEDGSVCNIQMLQKYDKQL